MLINIPRTNIRPNQQSAEVNENRPSYLVVGQEDELEDEDEANDGWSGVWETKAREDILLVDEVAKHKQC